MDGIAPNVRDDVRPLSKSAAQLQSIDAATARLTRVLYDARLEARLSQSFGLSDWHVGLDTGKTWRDPCWIELAQERSRANLCVDLAAHPALAAVATEPEDPRQATLNEPLRLAVAAVLMAPLIHALEALGAHAISVSALGRRQARAAALTVQFTRAGVQLQCRIGAIDRGWIELLELQLERDRVPLPNHISRIRVPGYFLVGEKGLKVKTLNALRPGDVIVRIAPPERAVLVSEPRATLDAQLAFGPPGAHQLLACVTLDANRLVISADPYMAYLNERTTPAPLDADSTTSVDELELPVKFEIETVALPLVQLSSLRAGYVIELQSTLRDARVRLVAYGQLIGVGELVTVGEQLGVRVVQMFSENGSV